jgi:hypothetical protein
MVASSPAAHLTRNDDIRPLCVGRNSTFMTRPFGSWKSPETAIISKRVLLLAMMFLFFCAAARSQEIFGDQRPRFLLDTAIGSETALGYKFPSISLGPAFEIPVGNRFEMQTSGTYSPDRKAITNDGHLAMGTGSVVAFANQRVGFVGSVERSWLWTSEFGKSVWYPSAGIVLRNDYFGSGRLYLSYVFPTGCVWATANNPCNIQSSRLQGMTVRQEARSGSHTRWGFESGFYHYCAQGNPDEPQAGRTCHWGATALVLLRFEFHCGSRSRFTPLDATDSDNF